MTDHSEDEFDDSFVMDDDSDIVAMLPDAYAAPPVSASLTRWLELEIADQWGHSPGLATKSTTAAVSLEGARRFASRIYWIAGATAATILFVVVLTAGRGGYAWAALVDAIQNQGLIQIDDEGASRWLDLKGQIIGQRQSDGQVLVIDYAKAQSVRSSAGSARVETVALAERSSPGRDALLAAFFCDSSLTPESIDRFRGLDVCEQASTELTRGEKKCIDLKVQAKSEGLDSISLDLRVNAETGMLLSCSPECDDAGANLKPRLLTVSYPRQTSRELLDRIVAGAGEVDPELLAAADPTRSVDSSSDSTSQDPELLTHLGKRNATDADASKPAPDQVAASFVASLPTGAPNKWKPVLVIRRDDADVIEQVNLILSKLWQDNGIEPVVEASGLQLLRRAYLDLAGRTPTVTEVRHYTSDERPDRYERLVERLLDSPDHASQMAATWRSFMIPEGVDLDQFGGREAFDRWLTEQFSSDESYDAIVRKLLLAEGRLSRSGPLLFYSALKLNADQLAARTSRAFLGMRLECAQCHDHPFEPWTQDDFWSYAAFFARISRPKGELENVSTVMQVRDVDRGDVMIPETTDIVEPKFLGESIEDIDTSNTLPPRRQRLAKWLTGPENPYFARATVNRVWHHLFGRGIVDPVDDFGELNEAVSPELLDTLASQFIDSGFDLRTLVRSIALSDAYRLSSSSDQLGESEDTAEERLTHFAQMNVKTLTAEQLYDCIAVATLMDQNAPDTSNQYALQRIGNTQRETFLREFATPSTNRSEYLAGIPQALMLMNGTLISQATGEDSSGMIKSLDAPFFTDQQRVDVLYMATLSRPARPEEFNLVADFIRDGSTPEQRREGLSNLLWVLINLSEFTLNH